MVGAVGRAASAGGTDGDRAVAGWRGRSRDRCSGSVRTSVVGARRGSCPSRRGRAPRCRGPPPRCCRSASAPTPICGGSRNDSSMLPFVFCASTVDEVSRRPTIRPLSFDTVMSPRCRRVRRAPSSLSMSTGAGHPAHPQRCRTRRPSTGDRRASAIVKSTLHHGRHEQRAVDARSSSTPSTTSLDTSVACQPSLTSAVTVTVSPRCRGHRHRSVVVVDVDGAHVGGGERRRCGVLLVGEHADHGVRAPAQSRRRRGCRRR